MKNKISKMGLIAVSALGLSGVASATIVYQDTFDNFNLTTNPNGIGGGLGVVTGSDVNNPYSEFAGAIGQGSSSNGGQNSTIYSTNAFSINGGFTLEVTFGITSTAITGNPPYPSNSFTFGLLDVATGSDASGAFNADDGAASTQYGIGMSFTERFDQGLHFDDGSTSSVLSNDQSIVTNANGDTQTFALTVDAAGNYSYSLNGATATAGTTTLDLTRDYHFVSFSQGANGGSLIYDVTLDAVPEPSSTALLGLGGLALILRRRK
ncbi:MAG: PEP-CTERM sorting domain-containing protein [Akkermansiaceae bacterium]